MKFAVLIFIFLAIFDVAKQNCFNPAESRKLQLLMWENSCNSPKEQLVELPVPQGFQYVVPSMQKVMRCANLICNGKDKRCEATETRRINISVEAVRVDKDSEKKECTQVEVEEHMECECRCPIREENCTPLQEYDEHTCSCNCKKENHVWCLAGPDGARWIENTCKCLMVGVSGQRDNRV